MPKPPKAKFLRRVVEFDYLVVNEHERRSLPNALTITTLGVQPLDRGQAELLGTRLLEWARREP